MTTTTMTILRLEKKLSTLPREPRHRLDARARPAPGLRAVLDPVAARMAADATSVPMPVLTAIAAVVWERSPGAAAALVDRGGPEVARQRAFGTAYGVVLHVLDGPAQDALLERLADLLGSARERAGSTSWSREPSEGWPRWSWAAADRRSPPMIGSR